MSRVNKKSLITAFTLVVVSAILSFAILNMVLVSGTKASERAEQELAEKGVVIVSSLEEASRIAGYQVSTPTFLPRNLECKRIRVVQLNNPYVLSGKSEPRPRPVEQHWVSQDGSSLLLIQSPGMSDIDNLHREPIKIAGVNGCKLLYEATENVPAAIEFHWKVDGMGYAMCGTITESLDEQILLNIANSIQSQ